MPEYAPMLHVSYYAQNYAGIIRQGLYREFLNLARMQFTVHAVKVLFHCTVVLR